MQSEITLLNKGAHATIAKQRQNNVSRNERPGAYTDIRILQPSSLGSFQKPDPGGLHEPDSGFLIRSCSPGRRSSVRTEPRRTTPAPFPSMLGASPSARSLSASGLSLPTPEDSNPRRWLFSHSSGGWGTNTPMLYVALNRKSNSSAFKDRHQLVLNLMHLATLNILFPALGLLKEISCKSI